MSWFKKKPTYATRTVPTMLLRMLAQHDLGQSATGIVAKQFDFPSKDNYPIPRDVGDLNLCLDLLRNVPQIDIKIMAGVSPEWDFLLGFWDDCKRLAVRNYNDSEQQYANKKRIVNLHLDAADKVRRAHLEVREIK